MVMPTRSNVEAVEPRVIVRTDRVKPFARRHPWIFGGAIDSVQGTPTDGEIVSLYAPNGQFLARGLWNSRSQIRVRVLTWDSDEPIDTAWWRARIERAVRARESIAQSGHGQTNAYRLINAENDGLPGLIVDRYGDWLVMQALSFGIDARQAEL